MAAVVDDGGEAVALDEGRCTCGLKEDPQSTYSQCRQQLLNSSLLSSSSSCSFLSFDSFPVQDYDKLRRVYTASVKGFSIGAGLKGGLALFSFLTRLRSRRSLPSSKKWTCFLYWIFKKCNIPMVTIGTFPAGLALAIEKRSRRIEISLFCLARAIESFFTCMADVGYLPHSKNLKRADVVVFSISTAIVMHCYAMERDVFRSKYWNVLDWVFGMLLPRMKKHRVRRHNKLLALQGPFEVPSVGTSPLD